MVSVIMHIISNLIRTTSYQAKHHCWHLLYSWMDSHIRIGTYLRFDVMHLFFMKYRQYPQRSHKIKLKSGSYHAHINISVYYPTRISIPNSHNFMADGAYFRRPQCDKYSPNFASGTTMQKRGVTLSLAWSVRISLCILRESREVVS